MAPKCACRTTKHPNRTTIHKEPTMPEPAPVPIDRAKKKPTTAAPPKVELVKVDRLPDLAKKPKIADVVAARPETATLAAGDWYQIVTYPSGSAGRGASTLTKDPRFARYEFAARGAAVYVRVKP
jgi:hypothetical protein